MAGYVRAHVLVDSMALCRIEPVACPGADEHTAGEIRCWTQLPGGEPRYCMHFVAAVANDNVTERLDTGSLARRAIGQGERQMRCGLICRRQRTNRPPGC